MAKIQSIEKPSRIAEASDETTQIWNDLNILQTDFCLPQELPVYYQSSHWLEASTVLDIGTGNGYYLEKLATRFPEKTFFGIDHAPGLIDIACKKTQSPNLQFAVEDLDTMTGSYDFVLLRLLLQHLTDPIYAMQRVFDVTHVGGCCLIIDAFDELRDFHPPFPAFVEFFKNFISATSEQGLDRNIVENLISQLEESGKWSVLKNLTLTIPSTWPGSLELFYKTYTRVVDLIETKRMFEWDFGKLRNSWKIWADEKNAYAQVGLRVLLLQRRK